MSKTSGKTQDWEDRKRAAMASVEGLEDLLVTSPNPPPFDGSQACNHGSAAVRDRFHPTGDEGRRNQYAELPPECGGCPFFIPCLHWAIWHEPEGVWAGTTPGKRQAIRSSLGLTLQGPSRDYMPTHIRAIRQAAATKTAPVRVGNRIVGRRRVEDVPLPEGKTA